MADHFFRGSGGIHALEGCADLRRRVAQFLQGCMGQGGIALMIDAAANLFSAFYVPSLIQKEPQCEKNQAQAKEEKTESSEEKEHP